MKQVSRASFPQTTEEEAFAIKSFLLRLIFIPLCRVGHLSAE